MAPTQEHGPAVQSYAKPKAGADTRPRGHRSTKRLAEADLIIVKAKKGRWTHYTRKDNGKRVCGARLRGPSAGFRCSAPPVAANGRCRMHGGNNQGRAPLVSGERLYADHLGAYRERFVDLLQRPDFLRTDPQAALVDVEIERLLAEAEAGVGPAWRAELSWSVGDLSTEIAAGPNEGQSAAAWIKSLLDLARKVEDLVNLGHKSDADRTRALELAETRAKIAIAERKQVTLEADLVPSAVVVASYGRIAEILFRTLDGSTAHRVVSEISRSILGAGGSSILREAGGTQATPSSDLARVSR